MQITVLVDNTTNTQYLKAEAGYSVYLVDGKTKILFDTGETSLFLENAQRLGINLGDLDYIVLSHGHHDHSRGLNYLLPLYTENKETRPVLLCHPQAFIRRIKNDQELGIDLTEDSLNASFTIKKSSEPFWITERLVFLGEIKRKFSFEGLNSLGQIVKDKTFEPDHLPDDTAIAYKSAQGLVIITGCSHSGICNIIEQAKEICQEKRILAVIGGLHLLKPSAEQLNNTYKYLRKSNIDKLYACHCTDLSSRIALAQIGNLQEVCVGLTRTFP